MAGKGEWGIVALQISLNITSEQGRVREVMQDLGTKKL